MAQLPFIRIGFNMIKLYREQRNQHIFDIALTGASYYSIADRFGLTNVAVWKIVRAEAKRRWGEKHKKMLNSYRGEIRKVPKKITCKECGDTYRGKLDKSFVVKYNKCIHCQEEYYNKLLESKEDHFKKIKG
jgi:hypothetical protein